MEPEIVTLAEKRLVGQWLRMSFTEERTFELWRGFMPRRKEIRNNIGSELYSVEVYEPGYFDSFKPEREFAKWAAIQATDFDAIPDGMAALTVPAGLYAVFLHRGPASAGPATYRYIFETWLPGSAFMLDSRPHFAVMGDRYKHEAPASEEDLWIPVRPKNI